MKALIGAIVALFRPARGLDKVGAAAKWLWVPLALLLMVSAVIKAGVGTPLQMIELAEQADIAFEEQMQQLPEEERELIEESIAEEEAVAREADIVEVSPADAQFGGVIAAAGVVTGGLGAILGLLYMATFFFIAAKTWAVPVGYTVMLTVASISLIPHAIRNFIQSAYMTATGDFLAHPGLSALVAPGDPLTPPGAAYAVLQQIDAWVIWGLLVLLLALLSQAVGFNRKQAITAMIAFVVVTGILGAVPTLVGGMLMGGMM